MAASLSTFHMLYALITICSVSVLHGFNIDVKNSVNFIGSPGSHFGFSVAFVDSEQKGKKILVGSPTANDQKFKGNVEQPGALYKCHLTENNRPDCEVAMGEIGGEVKPSDLSDKVFHSKKNGWLGAAIAVGEHVAYCSHRWENIFHPDVPNMNGLCYAVGRTMQLNPIQYALLSDPNKQYRLDNNSNVIPDYALGALGMSITSKNDDIIFGAPGLNAFSGGMVYSTARDDRVYEKELMSSKIGDLFGYSVCFGNFKSDNLLWIALGGPRAGLTGQVQIMDKSFKIQGQLNGKQIGSYFGASVCSTKVQTSNDKELLLVGSPFFSQKNDDGTSINEMTLDMTLTGSNKVKSRFGHAIGALGDINGDGFSDIAIGAPFEDDGIGAVYIYNGYTGGIWPKYTQRISGEGLGPNPPLHTFGSSITDPKTPFDFNGDNYGDMVVGAYSDNTAVLFYSHPPVSLKVDVKFVEIANNIIAKDDKTFGFKVCLSYSGDNLPQDIDVEYTVNIDTLKSEISKKRVRLDNGQTSLTAGRKVNLAFAEVCDENPQTVMVFSDADIFTPVVFETTFKITSVSSTATTIKPVVSKFDGNLQIPDETILSRQAELFREGCGTDNVCETDLSVDLNVDLKGESSLFIGPNAVFSVECQVTNNGQDWAYFVEIEIKTRKNIFYNQILTATPGNTVACAPKDKETLACSITRPLKGNENFIFKVEFDASGSEVEDLNIVANVSMTSEDTNMNNNVQSRIVMLATKALIDFQGVSLPEIYKTKDDSEAMLTVQHKFDFTNKGPSSLQKTTFTLFYPSIMIQQEKLFMVKYVTVTTFGQISIDVSCTENAKSSLIGTATSVQGQTKFSIKNVTRSEVTVLEKDCKEGGCQFLECDVSRVPINYLVSISAHFSMNPGIFQKYKAEVGGELESFTVQSHLDVSLPKNQKLQDNLEDHTKQATLTVYPKELSSGKGLAWWAILLIVLGAVLILGCIVACFWKIGFFKRKELEELEQKKKDMNWTGGPGMGGASKVNKTDGNESDEAIELLHNDTDRKLETLEDGDNKI